MANKTALSVVILLVAIVAVIVLLLLFPGQEGGESVNIPSGGAPSPGSVTKATLSTQGVLLAPESAVATGKIDVSDILDQLEREPTMAQYLAMAFSTMYQQSGIDVDKLDTAVFVVFDTNGPSEFVALLSGDFDEDLITSKAMATSGQETYRGINLIAVGYPTNYLAFVSDDLMLVGSPGRVKETIDRIKDGASTSFMGLPSISQLNSRLGSYPSYVFLKIMPQMNEDFAYIIPGMNMDALESVEATAFGFGGSKATKAVLLCSDAPSAERVKSLVEYIRSEALAQLSGESTAYGYPSGAQLETLQGMLQEITVTADGSFVVIEIPPLAELLTASLAWQMGVFSPSAGVAPGLSGFTTVKPIEWLCDSETGDLELALMNSAGQQIEDLTVEGGSCTDSTLAAGDTTMCTVPDDAGCVGVAAGYRFESTVTISYTTASGLSHQSTGTVWGVAE